jgi:methionyl aminopeptidase
MIAPRKPEELKLMRKSGEMSAHALKNVLKAVKSGVSLEELEAVVAETIEEMGGTASFKTVPGYHWYSCININEEVVHGIPRDIRLKKGDKVSIDLGALYKGWCTDTAWSVIVEDGEESEISDEEIIRRKKFLAVGEEAMWAGIKNAVAGKRIGDISEAMQKTIEGAGFEVVRSLVGHGIGKELHEAPEVPGFGKAGTGMVLQEGNTIAIEAIYTESTREVVLAPDGWTIASADGSLGGLFEMTVIVGKDRAEVITDWRKI